MKNQITVLYNNGKYYIYTVTHIDGKVFVDIKRIDQ